MPKYTNHEILTKLIEDTDWYHINFNGELVLGATSDNALYKASDILTIIRDVSTTDVEPVRHGKWTGRLTSDDVHAEGFSPWFTEEDKKARRELEEHITHCSNCKGQFDDRKTVNWNYCPYCGAKMNGCSKREVGFYIDPKNYNISQRLSDKGKNIIINKYPRCHKCVYEATCTRDYDNEGSCHSYKRDPKDGGFYG